MTGWTTADWAIALAIALVALTASVTLGSPLTRAVLKAAGNASDTAERAPGKETIDSAEAVLSGGRWIGMLERFAITASLLVGYPAAIAVVVAVKGLGRFPELKDKPAVSERFVIGTLASMVWSGALGAIGAWAIRLL